MKGEDWSATVLAVLIKRLGGSVTISRKELIVSDPMSINLEDDVMSGSIIFSVEDSTVIQGVVV